MQKYRNYYYKSQSIEYVYFLANFKSGNQQEIKKLEFICIKLNNSTIFISLNPKTII